MARSRPAWPERLYGTSPWRAIHEAVALGSPDREGRYEGGGPVIERRFPRFSVSGVRGNVSCAERVEIINMSVGGMAFKTDRLLEVGQEQKLTIDGGDFRVRLPAVAVWSKVAAVRWTDGKSVPVYTAGFRFVEGLPQETQKLVGLMARNKRVGIRFRIKAKGLVLLDVDDPCEVKLISRSGMLIRTERLFEVQSVYLMEIIPPEQVPIRMNGRVASQVESAQSDETYYDFGVEFTHMSEDDRQRLDVFVDSMSGG